MDNKLIWCCKQKKGIKLISPNDNLASEYLQSAEESLLVLNSIFGKSNMWLATAKYYCEYFSVYAFLMKCGIKCEIHDCTIEVCRRLEKQGFLDDSVSKMLDDDKELRIDNQYYLKNKKVDIDFNSLRDFVLNMKSKVNSISRREIEEIRRLVM